MTDLKVFAKNLEQTAIDQIETLAAQPAFEDARIRIMPDAHAGAGCVIGFTADLGEKIVPNLVGVDIGCGMLAVGINPIDDYAEFDELVKTRIPVGFSVHREEHATCPNMGCCAR
ncbi:MAG: RtcB family protein [Atopobiaceae bacterium]|nr:RtcB family protein [Atopobiaceae bacterium]